LPPLRREPSAIPASRWEDVQPMQPPYASDLIALPETPRRTAERFPPAEGPQAEAAAKGAELLLRVSGVRDPSTRAITASTFETLEEALAFLGTRLKLRMARWRESSTLLRFLARQRRLTDYPPG